MGEGESGECSINIYTLSSITWTAGEKLLCSTGSPVWSSVIIWREGMRGGEGRGGRGGREDMYVCMYNCINACIIVADVHCCMVKTNTTW